MFSFPVFTSIMTMVFNFVIVFIISLFVVELFLQMWQIIAFWHDCCHLFFNGIIFSFSKLIISIAFCPKDSQFFFMQSSSLYTSCSFFNYIDIVQLLLLKMIFQKHFSIHLFFSQRFKIYLNDRWCLIIFLVLIKHEYLSAFERHYKTTKIFIFTYFFVRSTLFFVLNSWRQFKQWKSPSHFEIISLNNADCFLL